VAEPAKVFQPTETKTEPRERVRRWAGVCRDGFPFVGISLLLTLPAFKFLGVFGGLFFGALTAFVVWFFRDPERIIPGDPQGIVSPADGTVLGVTRVAYPRFLPGEAQRVSIFMSVFNVHVNRVPCPGTVREVHYNSGKFLAAYAEKASLDNEQNAVHITADSGQEIVFVQIAGLIARRIICRLAAGERVSRGERFGLIRFGSRCDLYLPLSAEILVKKGDRLEGGSSMVGRFK
jgi:phosphatidylserine decarboxylase